MRSTAGAFREPSRRFAPKRALYRGRGVSASQCLLRRRRVAAERGFGPGGGIGRAYAGEISRPLGRQDRPALRGTRLLGRVLLNRDRRATVDLDQRRLIMLVISNLSSRKPGRRKP